MTLVAARSRAEVGADFMRHMTRLSPRLTPNLIVLVAALVLGGCVTRPHSYVGEDLAASPPPAVKLKQDPGFAHEVLEAQKRTLRQ
jgi:hypothetical protein